MKFTSIVEAEDYTKNVLDIPFVNFEGINLEVVWEIILTLKKAFNIYPELKKSICTIGQIEDINNQFNMIMYSSIYAIENDLQIGWENIECKGMMESYFFYPNNEAKYPEYVGLSFSSEMKNKSLKEIEEELWQSVKDGFHPRNCGTMSSVIWHEIGHILDSILDISNCSEFQDLIKGIDIEKEISGYALHSARDTWAEAFAEFHTAKEPESLFRNLGLLAKKKYLDLSQKSTKFDVARNYRL